MDRTLGLIYSQRVLLALIDTGLPREEAYDTVQPKAMEAWENKCRSASLSKRRKNHVPSHTGTDCRLL